MVSRPQSQRASADDGTERRWQHAAEDHCSSSEDHSRTRSGDVMRRGHEIAGRAQQTGWRDITMDGRTAQTYRLPLNVTWRVRRKLFAFSRQYYCKRWTRIRARARSPEAESLRPKPFIRRALHRPRRQPRPREAPTYNTPKHCCSAKAASGRRGGPEAACRYFM